MTEFSIGTRTAGWRWCRSELVAKAMEAAAPGTEIALEARQTTGDKILNKPLQEFGGKGVFVSEFEEGILEGRLDLAVHSAKVCPWFGRRPFHRGRAREGGSQGRVGAPGGPPFPESGEIVIGTSSPRRKLQIELPRKNDVAPGGGAL